MHIYIYFDYLLSSFIMFLVCMTSTDMEILVSTDRIECCLFGKNSKVVPLSIIATSFMLFIHSSPATF